MRKPTLAALVSAFGILVAIFIGGGLVESYANAIDNVHWDGRPLPPCFVDASSCGGHFLGTDDVGRDELARLIVGARTSLGMSLAAAVFELIILLSLIAAAKREAPTRAAVTYGAGAISCFTAWPFVVIVASIWYGPNSLPRLGIIALIAGVLMSARAITLEPQLVLTKRLVDRVTRDWSIVLLLLATVDFFGYGIQPPTASWGNMLADLQTNLPLAWWAAVFPAACLFLAALLIRLCARRPSTSSG